jgi:hypothetical protein
MPKDVEDDTEDMEDETKEPSSTPILIKTYGEFWNPELVNWKSKELLGKRPRPKGPDINVYEERGVYVLYKDYAPVYVGKADRQPIGNRLQLHRQSRRRGPRWDTFSWFGIRGLTKNDKLLNLGKVFRPRTEELIATLEALLIIAIDPRLNSRRENFKNADRLLQSDIEVETRLGSIEKKLDELLLERSNTKATRRVP